MRSFPRLLNLIISMFLLFSLNLGAAYAGKKETPKSLEGTTLVSAEDVIELIGSQDNLVLVDSRKTSDFGKGRIEGAINLPNTKTDEQSLSKIAPNKTGPILFYCNGIKCGRSVDSARKAISFGYTKIYWFRGGMEEWENKGFPVLKD